jgi:hypothetical protein
LTLRNEKHNAVENMKKGEINKRKGRTERRDSQQVEGTQEAELWLHGISDMQQLGHQMVAPELYPLYVEVANGGHISREYSCMYNV